MKTSELIIPVGYTVIVCLLIAVIVYMFCKKTYIGVEYKTADPNISKTFVLLEE
jgi:hypothetical protein